MGKKGLRPLDLAEPPLPPTAVEGGMVEGKKWRKRGKKGRRGG